MDKSCVPVTKLALGEEKSTEIVDKAPTAFGFAVIISTVGSSYCTRYGFISSTILEDYLCLQ